MNINKFNEALLNVYGITPIENSKMLVNLM